MYVCVVILIKALAVYNLSVLVVVVMVMVVVLECMMAPPTIVMSLYLAYPLSIFKCLLWLITISESTKGDIKDYSPPVIG